MSSAVIAENAAMENGVALGTRSVSHFAPQASVLGAVHSARQYVSESETGSANVERACIHASYALEIYVNH